MKRIQGNRDSVVRIFTYFLTKTRNSSHHRSYHKMCWQTPTHCHLYIIILFSSFSIEMHLIRMNVSFIFILYLWFACTCTVHVNSRPSNTILLLHHHHHDHQQLSLTLPLPPSSQPLHSYRLCTFMHSNDVVEVVFIIGCLLHFSFLRYLFIFFCLLFFLLSLAFLFVVVVAVAVWLFIIGCLPLDGTICEVCDAQRMHTNT